MLFWGVEEAVGYSMKVCILILAILRINEILGSYKVPGVLDHLSSNALSGVERAVVSRG